MTECDIDKLFDSVFLKVLAILQFPRTTSQVAPCNKHSGKGQWARGRGKNEQWDWTSMSGVVA